MDAVFKKYSGNADQLAVYTKAEQKSQVMTYLKILKRFTGAQTVEAVGKFLLKKEKDDEYLETQERKEKQFKWIMDQTFDFFGLQEFDNDMNTAYEAKKTDKYGIILGPSPKGKLDVAILYNKSWTPSGAKKVFVAGVAQDFKNKEETQVVTVVCAHLKSGKKDRKKRKPQAKQIMDHIAPKPNVIICVDANDTKGAELFTNPDGVSGNDDDISKKSSQPCIPNYDSEWTSDHYALRAALGTSETLIKVDSQVLDKVGQKEGYASTTKRRGASSEQLSKIGEWVSGTIDFILAKGGVAGISAWSWNLLNRADGFLLPGDPLEEKDKAQQDLVDEFNKLQGKKEKEKRDEVEKIVKSLTLKEKEKRLIEKIGQKKYDELVTHNKDLDKELVEIEFIRGGMYYHWEQEVIRLAHFYAKAKAAKAAANAAAKAAKAAERRKRENQMKRELAKKRETGQRRKNASELRAKANRSNKPEILTQNIVPFGKKSGKPVKSTKGFTFALRF